MALNLNPDFALQTRLSASLLAGGSWWLLAAGAALLVIPATAGLSGGRDSVAIVASSTAVALVLLALPARPSAAWVSLLLVPALGGLLAFAKFRGSRLLLLASVAAASVVTIVAAPAAIALMARAGRTGASGFSRGWRLGEFARTRFPEFVRGLASTEKPAAAAIATALMPVMVISVIRQAVPESRAPGFVAAAYSPLVGIAFLLSSRLRAHRDSGGLKRMRVASRAYLVGLASAILVLAAMIVRQRDELAA